MHGFSTLLGRTLDLLSYKDIGLTILALIAICGLVLAMRRPNGWRFAVPLAMAAAAFVTIAAFPDLLTVAIVDDSWRVTRPLVIAPLLVLVALLCAVQPVRLQWRSEQALPVVMTAAAAVLLALWVGQVEWSVQFDRVRTLRSGIERAADFDTDPYTTVRTKYTVLKRALPSDATFAYAVDEPELLEGAGQTGYNLDILGANSPRPGLPFFRGRRRRWLTSDPRESTTSSPSTRRRQPAFTTPLRGRRTGTGSGSISSGRPTSTTGSRTCVRSPTGTPRSTSPT